MSFHNDIESMFTNETGQIFKSVMGNLPVMIWMANPDKNITYLNQEWLDFTGCTREEQLGLGWLDRVHTEDVSDLLEKYSIGFRNLESFQIEFRFKNFNNEFRWVRSLGRPAYLRDDEYIGYVGSCHDIHQERLMNDEMEQLVRNRTIILEESNAELEKSNKELEQFAYVASHDLQEPLRKIMTFSGRLEELYKRHLPIPGQELIDKILVAAQRMRLLIDDLLSFSRLIKMTGELQPTDLNEILEDVIQDFELRIQESKAIIRYDRLPTITAFPVQMQQLFYNLFSNALKFTREGVRPEINIRNVETDQNELHSLGLGNPPYIKIQFSDNGIGFNQEFSDEAFKIFHRLHKNEYSGTGIGLALCRKIVEQHEGMITAVSEENKGTTFTIHLRLIR